MKVLKLYSLSFQRNGVHGEPFYAALIKFEDAEIEVDNFLLTFPSSNDDKTVDLTKTRGVYLGDVTASWRGDTLAYMMQEYLNKEMQSKGGTFYDLCLCTKPEIYSVITNKP